jgi:hypothetical protein
MDPFGSAVALAAPLCAGEVSPVEIVDVYLDERLRKAGARVCRIPTGGGPDVVVVHYRARTSVVRAWARWVGEFEADFVQ